MSDFKPTTEFGRRFSWELRNINGTWAIYGVLSPYPRPNRVLQGWIAHPREITLWLALPPALTTPEVMAEEPKAVELTDSQSRFMRFLEGQCPAGCVVVRGSQAEQEAYELDALGLVHTVLDGDRVLFVAGQPEPSCGRLVPGSRQIGGGPWGEEWGKP